MVYLSQTFVVTGLLFYFGWVRASTTFAYFGIDVGALGLGSADYLLRSGTATFTPLLALALLVIVCVCLESALVWLLVSRAGRSVYLTYGAVSGLVLLAVSHMLGAWFSGYVYFSLLVTALFIVALTRIVPRLKFEVPPVLLAAIGVVVVSMLFMGFGIQAEQTGLNAAKVLELGIKSRPEVRLYSKLALPVDKGDGVEVERIWR
jgi:hypothetical protein